MTVEGSSLLVGDDLLALPDRLLPSFVAMVEFSKSTLLIATMIGDVEELSL